MTPRLSARLAHEMPDTPWLVARKVHPVTARHALSWRRRLAWWRPWPLASVGRMPT